MDLSERIRKRREELGLSQLEVLYRMRDVGLRRAIPTLRSWESGEISPRAAELEALAQALDVTVGWIVGEQAAVNTSARRKNPRTTTPST